MFALLVKSMAEYRFTESLNRKENMKLRSVKIYFLRGNCPYSRASLELNVGCVWALIDDLLCRYRPRPLYKHNLLLNVCFMTI